MPAWAGRRPKCWPAISDPQHPGRHAGRRWHADRAWVSHRPLGSRPAGASRGPRAEATGRRAVCRLLHRSVRRPHARHGRHVRQSALSQRRGDFVSAADSFAAHAARRAGRGHLRQRFAGHDAGPGRHGRIALRARARRRDVAAGRGRERRPNPIDRRPLCARRNHAGSGGRVGLQGLREPRRRLPISGHGRHQPGRGRGLGHVAAALGLGPQRAADLARHGPTQRAGLGRNWPSARSRYGRS